MTMFSKKMVLYIIILKHFHFIWKVFENTYEKKNVLNKFRKYDSWIRIYFDKLMYM